MSINLCRGFFFLFLLFYVLTKSGFGYSFHVMHLASHHHSNLRLTFSSQRCYMSLTFQCTAWLVCVCVHTLTVLLSHWNNLVWHLATVPCAEMAADSKCSKAQCHIDGHCLICCHGDKWPELRLGREPKSVLLPSGRWAINLQQLFSRTLSISVSLSLIFSCVSLFLTLYLLFFLQF